MWINPDPVASAHPPANWQPGHFTSMKKELGDCTKRLSLCFRFSSLAEGWRRSRTMVFGGGVLLGTCVGFRGSVGGSAGGEVSGAVARRKLRAAARSDAFCGFAATSARRGARRRARGWPPRRFFEQLKQVSPTRRFDHCASRACHSSPYG